MANNLVSFVGDAVKMVNVFVVHEKDHLLRLEDADAEVVDFSHHWDQKRVQRLVHETLDVAKLFITFFLDVVFHFVSDETVGNLVTD